jgi:hypothetical protein
MATGTARIVVKEVEVKSIDRIGVQDGVTLELNDLESRVLSRLLRNILRGGPVSISDCFSRGDVQEVDSIIRAIELAVGR